MTEPTKIFPIDENALRRLAALADIDQDHGWRKRLAKKLGIKSNTMGAWIDRGNISKDGINKILRSGYPPEKWLTPPYVQTEEKVQAHPRGVVTVIQPEDAIFIQKVQQILSSDERATASALKENINAFYEQVQDRKKIRALEKRVADLEREVTRSKKCCEPSEDPSIAGEG